MLTKQVGNGDEMPESIKDMKNIEMEKQRRGLEERSAKKRELRQWHIEQREAAEAESPQRAKEAADRKVRQIERTQRLAEELARRKHIELQESLKSRKAKSAVPFVTSQRLKKMETELDEIKKQDEELQSSEKDSAWHFTETPAATLQERKLNYKRDLQKQLIDNRRRLLAREEEKHRERKTMEEVQEAMHKENVEMEKRKQETIALLKAERNAFLKARKFWKEKRGEVLKQEYDEIARIIAKREALQKCEAERKSDKLTAKEAMLEKQSSKLIEEARKKMEREDICRELYIIEQENEIAHDEMRRALKKKRTARELLQDMARYQKSIAEKKEKERAIDAAFATYIADERKKQEENEKQKEQARRERFVQYGKELRETIMKNSVQRAKEAAQMKSQRSKQDYEKPKSKCYSESNLETLNSHRAEN